MGRLAARIQAGTAKIISNAQVQERFAKLGLTAYGTSPSDFQTYLGTEIANWDRLVRVAGVRPNRLSLARQD